jgi:hypothetical protein
MIHSGAAGFEGMHRMLVHESGLAAADSARAVSLAPVPRS